MTEVFNNIDNTGIISWKGQTINQISSFVKKIILLLIMYL